MSEAGAAIRRVLTLAAAVGLAVLVTVSAERARPTPTPLGSALGLVPLEPRLARVSDAVALGRRPSLAEFAFARASAEAAPLDALPYFIATAAPGRGVAEQRALVALALQRDPRLRPALAWRVGDLARSNDVAGLTRTLIRLALLTPSNPKLWPAVVQLSVDPVARAVIKQQIAHGDQHWRDGYLKALSQSSIDRAVAFEMVRAIGRQSPDAGAIELGQFDDRRAFLAALVAHKEYERAYLAWVQWLPATSQAAAGPVFDGGFTGAQALPPFAWQLTDGVGGSTVIDPAAGLALDYAGTDGAIVAQQLLLLVPGHYRLVTQANFRAVPSDGGPSSLAWSLTCLPGGVPLSDLGVPLVGAAQRAAGAPFEIKPGCDIQTLVLKVNSAEFAKRLSGKIRSISVEAVQ